MLGEDLGVAELVERTVFTINSKALVERPMILELVFRDTRTEM